MKKRTKIVWSWVLSIVVSGTGILASQQPKLAPDMMFVDNAVRDFVELLKLDSERQKILEAKLNEIATQEHAVGREAALEIALSVRDMSIPEKIKRPEEDIVAQFLPIPGVVTEVGRHLPLRWNVHFKPGQESQKLGAGLNFIGVRACANGHYLALEQDLDVGARKILFWDMLKMAQDENLSYTISFKRSRPVWDISPQGDILVYIADKNIVGVNLRNKKQMFRKEAHNVDDLSFSLSGNFVLGYIRALGQIKMWDMATGNEIVAESQAFTERLRALPISLIAKNEMPIDDYYYTILSPDGKKLAVIKNEQNIMIWDLNAKTVVKEISAHRERSFDRHSCVFDGGWNKIAVISREGEKSFIKEGKLFLEVWDLTTGIRECNEPQKNTAFLSFCMSWEEMSAGENEKKLKLAVF